MLEIWPEYNVHVHVHCENAIKKTFKSCLNTLQSYNLHGMRINNHTNFA